MLQDTIYPFNANTLFMQILIGIFFYLTDRYFTVHISYSLMWAYQTEEVEMDSVETSITF